jgi:sulfane dehydrogenase subunit SoxC
VTREPHAGPGADAPARGAPVTRRALLAGAAAAAAGTAVDALPLRAGSQQPVTRPGGGAATQAGPHAAQTAPPAATAPTGFPAPPPDATKVLGTPTTARSERSPFVAPARTPVGVLTGASFTPLQDLTGTITPTDLHFERHHGGVAHIDPSRYKLLVHGLADRELAFTLDDLRRLPSVTRVYFVECAGNGRAGYRAPKRELSPQLVDGMTSNSEWTGVPLASVLGEVGVRRAARWVLAEGGDAAVLSRSVPLEKAMDDALLAYAQNGEPLRPAHGYPVRLLLPGWEANTCVKWLRRLELIAVPNMSRDETAKYTDPLPDGTARQFSFAMDVKSTITAPAYPARLAGRGWVPVRGLAWSGRGRVTRVDVSTDGGRTWTEAELQGPVLPKAHTRFQHMWAWDGGPATLMSRAVDETGAVQPTRAAFRAGAGRRDGLPLQPHPRVDGGAGRPGVLRGGPVRRAGARYAPAARRGAAAVGGAAVLLGPVAACGRGEAGAAGEGAAGGGAAAAAARPADVRARPERPARYGVGRPAAAAELAAWDLDANARGVGLPPGRGTHATGAVVYAAKCASCHGARGEGTGAGAAAVPRLVGREPRDGFPFGQDLKHVRTVGNYWPYATTVYDYIRRAMPLNAPGSLRPDEVYAVTAFLLAENGVTPRDLVLDARSLPRVRMPARDRFVPDDRSGGPAFR